MKKLIVILVIWVSAIVMPLELTSGSYIHLKTAVQVYGCWTSWQSQGYINSYGGFMRVNVLYREDTFVGLRFRNRAYPSDDWVFQFTIDDYNKPDKKTRKEHIKYDIPYEYSGTAEYYVSDDYPTIDKVLKEYGFPRLRPHGENVRVKRTAKARIKIQAYKKEPTRFYIYFDLVGIGIDLSKWPFERFYVVQ